MSESVNISIPSDDEGFVSFQCPHCNERFKLLVNEVQEDDVIQLFCPKCGLLGEPNSFITDDVIDHANTVIENIASEMINDFVKNMGKSFRNNKNISFKPGKKLDIEHPKSLYEKDNDFEEHKFKCCDKQAKIKKSSSYGYIYCPYCGV